MGRVITTSDTGSMFVGEFYRNVGRPKPKRKRGRPAIRQGRDAIAHWLREQGVSWADTARLCGFDRSQDIKNPSFDPIADARTAVKRLKRRGRIALVTHYGVALHGD